MNDRLLLTAVGMLRTNSKRQRFAAAGIEGTVRTAFQFACLGNFTGIIFSANVETELGQGQVDYLVDPVSVALEEEEIIRDSMWEDVTENFKRAEAAQWN
jgi:hypothetical protein